MSGLRRKGARGVRIKLGDLAFSERRRKAGHFEDRRNSQRGAAQSNDL